MRTCVLLMAMARARLLVPVATAGQGIWREAKPAARLVMRPLSERTAAAQCRRQLYPADEVFGALGFWHLPVGIRIRLGSPTRQRTTHGRIQRSPSGVADVAERRDGPNSTRMPVASGRTGRSGPRLASAAAPNQS